MALNVTFPATLRTDRDIYAAAAAFAHREGLNWDRLPPHRRLGLMVSQVRHSATVSRTINGTTIRMGRYDDAMRRLPKNDPDYVMTRMAVINHIAATWPWLLDAAVKQMG